MAVSVGLSGCSGSDRLTKAKLVAMLNSMCADRDDKTEFMDDANVFSVEDGATVLDRMVPIGRDFLGDVRDLNPPEDAESLLDRYADDSEESLDSLDDAIAAAAKNDARAYNKGLGSAFIGFDQSDQTLAEYGADKCFNEEEAMPPAQTAEPGATKVPVSAGEYTFEFSGPVKAGATAFELTNRGNEIHFLGLARLKEGATVDQVREAAMTGGDTEQFIEEEQGSSTIAPPDGTAVLNAELTPGTYAAFCFIPAADGKSHAEKGMVAEVTVA